APRARRYAREPRQRTRPRLQHRITGTTEHPAGHEEPMKHSRAPLTRYAAALVLSSATLVFANAAPASAVACSSPVRYASSSSTISLVPGQSFPLPATKSYCPAAPLTVVDQASKTWELSADLILQNGSTLNLHGTPASGDVDTLRLKSLSDNQAT